MPVLFFQIFTLVSDSALLIFVIYYFFKFRNKEHEINIREKKIDTDYHQVVDTALARERKIIDDATDEAGQIIKNTQYVTNESEQAVEQILQQIANDIKQKASGEAQNFTQNYQDSLKQLSDQSLSDFTAVVANLKSDLQKQVSEFHASLLPALEKEIEEYKKERLAETDKTINNIIQKVSMEVFNKSISTTDHQKLIIESLDKAKKQGIFE